MAEIQLTPQQQQAVQSRGGALLVSAAAGSGKTRVLVERVMQRLCDPMLPKNINDFLIITYTNAAAAELRGKLAAAIGNALAKEPDNRHLQRQLSRIYIARISTVHSFCAAILRDYAHELGIYPDFRVVQEQEAALWQQQAMEHILSEAYANLDAAPERRAFLDRLGAGRDDRTSAAILMQAYRSVQCQSNPAEWLEGCAAGLSLPGVTDMAQTIWGKLLIEDFMLLLAEQLAAMEQAIAALASCPRAEEKYGPVFRANLEQMQYLHESTGWDELCRRRITDFGRLSPVRGVEKEVLERLKKPRALCIAWLKKAQSVFSMSSAQALEELRQGTPVILGMFSLLKAFTASYEAIKQRNRALDFDDLEHAALRLLYDCNGAPSPAAEELRSRYCEIMVDEYQDSNGVQDRIFAAVSRDGENLFMVGDVKQSIYRFRLADPGIFLEKYARFKDAAAAQAGEPRRVLLSQNFRSRKEILYAVNDIFRLTMTPQVGDLRYTDAEALYPGAALPEVARPCVELHCLDCTDREEGEDKRSMEARLVAKRVAQLLHDGTLVTASEGLRKAVPGDIVILLRSLRSQAQSYLSALRELGIEAVSDQSDDILKTGEVSLLLSYLQVLDNPHQDIPLISVLLSPVFGFTAQQVAQVRIGRRSGDFYQALLEEAQENETFTAFLNQLSMLRRAAREEPVGQLIRRVWEETGLRDVFAAMEDGAQRLENLQAIYLRAAAFDPDGPGRLHDFLEKLEQQKERGITGAGVRHANAVRIMSIHKSKGLEFPIVIVAGLSTTFNTADERQPVQIHPLLGTGCDVVDLDKRIKYPSLAKQAILGKLRQERLSEELRVLYVALTRPKDLLIMTYASGYLKKRLTDLSDQLRPDGPIGLSRRAGCLGHWVLMAALQRAEAGELFLLGGQPEETSIREFPWVIRLWKPEDLAAPPLPIENTEEPPAMPLPPLHAGFQYPHQKATVSPAKLTATQLKGRFLDAESAERAPEGKRAKSPLRQPLFLQGQRPLSPTERGTSVHLAMQYIRYEACTDEAAVREELSRLVAEGFLLPQQAQCVPPEKLMALFRSELGKRILSAPEVIREFIFSLLTDGGEYDPELRGERIMLQGVTDCCLREPDGLCVIDFKTDRIRPGAEADRAAHYRGQLEAYSSALSQIFACPVKEKILYFFATDTAFYL